MHARSIAVFDRFLGALSKILQTAEAHCSAHNIKPEALLNFRLFPDMLDFTRQVQLSCDFAARTAARLVGDPPKAFADTETSFAELQSRIAATRAYITSFDPDRFDGAETRSVVIKMHGKEVAMQGEAFAYTYAMPQFFFHITTAYNILRHNGIVVGKGDYMGGA